MVNLKIVVKKLTKKCKVTLKINKNKVYGEFFFKKKNKKGNIYCLEGSRSRWGHMTSWTVCLLSYCKFCSIANKILFINKFHCNILNFMLMIDLQY